MPPTGFAELVLVVRDVPLAAHFYREIVGLPPATQPTDSWAWFWAGAAGTNQRLAVHKGPLQYEEHSPLPAGRRFGPIHFALEVPRDQLDAQVERLRAHGVALFGPRHFEWMRATSYYFYDPDANLVEFWSPDPGGLAGDSTGASPAEG